MLADSPPASMDDDVYRPNMDNIPMDDATTIADDDDDVAHISLAQGERAKKSGHRQGKKRSSTDRLDAHLINILSAVESTSQSSKVPVASSSKEAMTVLHNMEGVEICGPLFMLGTRLFRDDANCDFFLNSLASDFERMAWLHQEHAREM
uniref:Uncharacterized protein n=1 Tax=Davidia involucrata TaxID=16924 RepID=A0A5B6Z5H0_DAVIN